ncbi:MAG: hypothetical protein HYZ54_09545 [Ignavibacteriae bacterium]|nr:hypothetical protein [Ignavibacteriota bacterium]
MITFQRVVFTNLNFCRVQSIMLKKITLVIAGGVSLGTFEAGAITELLYALEEHNKKDPENRFSSM